MRNSTAALLLALLSTGCGLTDPVPTLVISGTVTDTSGAPVPNADVTLRYVSPLDLTVFIRDQVATGTDGRYRVETGPPSGQDEIACSQLTVFVREVGFAARSIRLSTVDACSGAGSLDLDVELTPDP